jgi:hypothetical protein
MRLTSILFAIACGASCAVACGGSKSSSGNGGTGDDASTGNSSGSASSSGSGSTSSSGAGDDAAAAGDDAGASCTDSSSCPGQVCCATVSIGGATGFGFTEACAASCTGAMAFQLCSSTAECMTAGDTCTPSPLGMGSYCAPPIPDGGFMRRDGGFPGFDGGPQFDSGGATEGGGPSDAAVE